MSGKNLVLEFNAKIVSANQIAGFLIFNISKTIGDIKLIFCMQVHIYESCKLIIQVYVDVVRHGQASPKRLLKL